MEKIKTLGVMTGNSLDAVDVVLSEFSSYKIEDIQGLTLPYSNALRNKFMQIKEILKNNPQSLSKLAQTEEFISTINEYTSLVAQAVNEVIEKAKIDRTEIAAIGFHGQTCGHLPPSLAGSSQAYTIQVGNPNLLADLTGLPVIYDFRSDDMLNGGEGAPLAPMHNAHLATSLKARGISEFAFCNGGNTGNIAIISDKENGENVTLGWDSGPFNHFPDMLTQKFFKQNYDKNGLYGRQGTIKPEILKILFETAAQTPQGENYYLLPPPKSSDPAWYHLPDLQGFNSADVLRTAEYLSTYAMFHSLKYVPEEVTMPKHFLVFGGGWRNPLVLQDFNNLLAEKGVVLAEHQEIFENIRRRIGKSSQVCWSDEYGINGQYMEARIFADMAYCKIKNIPFTTPQMTNSKTPTVCGQWCYPHSPQQPLFNRAYPGRNGR